MKGAHVSHHVRIEYRSLNLVKMLLNVCGRWVNEVHPHGRETCRRNFFYVPLFQCEMDIIVCCLCHWFCMWSCWYCAPCFSVEVILRAEAVETAQAGDKCDFIGSLIVVPDVGSLSLNGEWFHWLADHCAQHSNLLFSLLDEQFYQFSDFWAQHSRSFVVW